MLEKIFFCTFLLKGEVEKSTFLAKKIIREKFRNSSQMNFVEYKDEEERMRGLDH